ncbi:MAG: DUF3365 domain-containing protein [Flavobacteriales bacterium]|nr:DUF3365 domain-containing protein [Flavobacteriales bacterium]
MTLPKLTVLATIIAGIFLLSNCADKPKEATPESQTITAPENFNREGVAVFSQNCSSCHPTKAGVDNGIAPSFAELKAGYLKKNTTKEAFVASMVGFLSAPAQSKSQMPELFDKYALMPNLGFTDEQYAAVARYIYHSAVEDVNWNENQYQQDLEYLKHAPKEATNYLKEGKDLALATKAVLGKNLLNAIQQRGTEHALEFCNTRAIPLTDSMAVALNASIKRVSDRNRNPNNAANQQELDYIAFAKNELAEGRTPKGKLTEIENKAIGYYPILTNKMCLQCHGKPQADITPETLSMIEKLYPSDLATGYGENELRGIWVIEMEK